MIGLARRAAPRARPSSLASVNRRSSALYARELAGSSSSARRYAAVARAGSPSIVLLEHGELEQRREAVTLVDRDLGAALEQRAQVGPALIGAVQHTQRVERVGGIGLELEDRDPRALGGRPIGEPVGGQVRELGRDLADLDRRAAAASATCPARPTGGGPTRHRDRAARRAPRATVRTSASGGSAASDAQSRRPCRAPDRRGRRGRCASACDRGRPSRSARSRPTRAGPRARPPAARPAGTPRGAAGSDAPPRPDRPARAPRLARGRAPGARSRRPAARAGRRRICARSRGPRAARAPRGSARAPSPGGRGSAPRARRAASARRTAPVRRGSARALRRARWRATPSRRAPPRSGRARAARLR